MSWIALLLAGIAVADLGHSIRPVRVVPECVGAGFAVVLGLACGLTGLRDVLALVVIAGVIPMVDRGDVAAARFAKRNIPFHALVTYRDLGLEPVKDG